MSNPVKTCSVEGCERKRETVRGWCNMHYKRWKRNGEPGEASLMYEIPPSHCTASNCDRVPLAKGLCQKHYARLLRGGASNVNEPSFHDDDFLRSYSAAHKRVRKVRGRASDEICIDCGSVAFEWSYRHDDPDELTDERGISYSINVEHYDPRCVPCHRIFDTGRVNSSERNPKL